MKIYFISFLTYALLNFEAMISRVIFKLFVFINSSFLTSSDFAERLLIL